MRALRGARCVAHCVRARCVARVAWRALRGARCVARAVWRALLGSRCVARVALRALRGARCVARAAWSAVRGARCVARAARRALRGNIQQKMEILSLLVAFRKSSAILNFFNCYILLFALID